MEQNKKIVLLLKFRIIFPLKMALLTVGLCPEILSEPLLSIFRLELNIEKIQDFLEADLSNGNSRANLASASTRQKFAVFGECEYSPKRPFSEIRETRQTRDIRQAILRVLADIRQTVLRGLARLAKGEFGECYANLASVG
jgi:hypothetical protein